MKSIIYKGLALTGLMMFLATVASAQQTKNERIYLKEKLVVKQSASVESVNAKPVKVDISKTKEEAKPVRVVKPAHMKLTARQKKVSVPSKKQ